MTTSHIHPTINILIFSLFLHTSLSQICTQPQKTFYMSLSSLSKRDDLTKMFDQLNTKSTVYANKFTDSETRATYAIRNMTYGVYYNDHLQQQKYIDKYQVNVSMGQKNVGTNFQYQINYEGSVKHGKAFGRSMLDPSYFVKTIVQKQGYLEWQPKSTPPLQFTQLIVIESSQPTLTDKEKSFIYKLINDQAGSVKVKTQIINEVNLHYADTLKQFLNHQDLISSTNITYTHSNISLVFGNNVKEFQISNDKTKGLEAFILFGLDSNKENCTKLDRQFDEDQYGGVQQIFSMGIVRSMLNEAISKGLFDIHINKDNQRNWQTARFQFYMGDLGNSVDYANNFKASDNFEIKCELDKQKIADAKISRYDEHELYLSVPQICHLLYQQRQVIKVVMDVNMVLKVLPDDKSFKVSVKNTGIYHPQYTSIDSNFVVTDEYLAQYSITQTLKKFVNETVFGHGFPLVMRKYPAMRIFDDRILVFDPSEK